MPIHFRESGVRQVTEHGRLVGKWVHLGDELFDLVGQQEFLGVFCRPDSLPHLFAIQGVCGRSSSKAAAVFVGRFFVGEPQIHCPRFVIGPPVVALILAVQAVRMKLREYGRNLLVGEIRFRAGPPQLRE